MNTSRIVYRALCPHGMGSPRPTEEAARADLGRRAACSDPDCKAVRLVRCQTTTVLEDVGA